MRVHDDHDREFLDVDHPQGLGDAELLEHENALVSLDGLGEHLSGAAHGVQVDGTRVLGGRVFQGVARRSGVECAAQ